MTVWAVLKRALTVWAVLKRALTVRALTKSRNDRPGTDKEQE